MTKLAMFGGVPVISAKEARFTWPIVTSATEAAVLKQLHAEVSIYNYSGVFAEFEDSFAAYHNRSRALLSNSGTSAIFSMFEGINLKPGDEIICPTYTFYATISPVVYTGATPIFCDAGDDGNIDPIELEKCITNRTKAVIVTHMWGIPCEMDRIVQICRENDLFLLEDCSHAHGASYRGKKVDSFGDAAAWSLQGQKIVSGGEGGIMVTDDEEIFTRALLQGHYNKRCKQQISPEHPLYHYALTGFGLKLRAHPLAIAMAKEQFSHLDEWIRQKHIFAEEIINALAEYSFLKMPRYTDRQPSWYAFIIQFFSESAGGVSIEQFVRALHAEGLVEVDRPMSTCPIHTLPLFTETNRALDRLYSAPIKKGGGLYCNSIAFYNTAIKIPIWAFTKDSAVVRAYIEGFRKVCDVIASNPQILIEQE